jgi:hypothetical protein
VALDKALNVSMTVDIMTIGTVTSSWHLRIESLRGLVLFESSKDNLMHCLVQV